MENASRALLIAGGVLISILIISLVIYLNTSITSIANSQEQKKAAQQLAEFNRSYEMYNKSVMYGIDVITVVNKAIEHNKSMDVSESETPYYINIIIKIDSEKNSTEGKEFKTTGRKINTKLPSDHKDYDLPMDSTDFDIIGKADYGTIVSESYGLSNGEYSLGSWDNDELKMNEGVLKFFSQEIKDYTKKIDGTIYYVYSGLTNFKRAIFKCTDVKYSEVTGRVNEMTFEYVEN